MAKKKVGASKKKSGIKKTKSRARVPAPNTAVQPQVPSEQSQADRFPTVTCGTPGQVVKFGVRRNSQGFPEIQLRRVAHPGRLTTDAKHIDLDDYDKDKVLHYNFVQQDGTSVLKSVQVPNTMLVSWRPPPYRRHEKNEWRDLSIEETRKLFLIDWDALAKKVRPADVPPKKTTLAAFIKGWLARARRFFSRKTN